MLMLIAALVGAQPMPPSVEQPDLDWLAGYWLSCRDGVEVSETWSSRRGGIMLGSSITIGDDAFGWEQIRIEASGDGLVFHALPRGQPSASFRLVRSDRNLAVFENPAHDFPQRVIYRRAGDRLTGRIEGVSAGNAHAIEWNYRKAAFNSRCGAVEDGASED